MTEQEKLLRENIRHMIRHVKQKKLNEENELRTVIRKFMDHELKDMMNEASVADVDPTPNKSTGINVLEELLKKIIPVLETDYKSLTTNKEQRDSFRAHIINAAVNTLTPAKVNTDAGDETEELQEQDIEVTVDDDAAVGLHLDGLSVAEDQCREGAVVVILVIIGRARRPALRRVGVDSLTGWWLRVSDRCAKGHVCALAAGV